MAARLRPQGAETRIARRRRQLGLTQEDMSWATGIPIATYNRLERGKLPNPGIRHLANAAIVLRCDPADLISDGMRRWRDFGTGRLEPPPDEWYERDEVRARAKRWRLYKEQGGEPTVPFAAAASLTLGREGIFSFLNQDRRGDALFKDAFEQSLAAVLPDDRRTALGWVTGHHAESVVAAALVNLGWRFVWRFVEPGHRVDLLMRAPGRRKRVFAVEVAGTLRPGHWPQPRRGPLTKKDIEWLSESENKAMTDHVKTEDVFGAIVLVNFHDLLVKAVLTTDFVGWRPVESPEQLKDLNWLDSRGRPKTRSKRSALSPP